MRKKEAHFAALRGMQMKFYYFSVGFLFFLLFSWVASFFPPYPPNHPMMEEEEANPNLQLNTALWQCGNSV
jgi:hypothetical protein